MQSLAPANHGGRRLVDRGRQPPRCSTPRTGSGTRSGTRTGRRSTPSWPWCGAQSFAGFALWRLGQEDPGIWQIILAVRSPCDPVPPFVSTRYIWYIRETGHSLQGAFLNYWNAHGGVSIFGYPLTEEFQEANPIDGQVYTVQYFERKRFEYHPEARGTPYEVQLGLLGVQISENRFFPLGPSIVTTSAHLLPADGPHAQRRASARSGAPRAACPSSATR